MARVLTTAEVRVIEACLRFHCPTADTIQTFAGAAGTTACGQLLADGLIVQIASSTHGEPTFSLGKAGVQLVLQTLPLGLWRDEARGRFVLAHNHDARAKWEGFQVVWRSGFYGIGVMPCASLKERQDVMRVPRTLHRPRILLVDHAKRTVFLFTFANRNRPASYMRLFARERTRPADLPALDLITRDRYNLCLVFGTPRPADERRVLAEVISDQELGDPPAQVVVLSTLPTSAPAA